MSGAISDDGLSVAGEDVTSESSPPEDEYVPVVTRLPEALEDERRAREAAEQAEHDQDEPGTVAPDEPGT
jgi:hypothetical protein